MSDRNVIAAQRWFDDQESANERACYEAAQKAGVQTQEAADACEEGECCCPECPWKDTARRWRRQRGLVALRTPPVVWLKPEPPR